MVDRRVGGRDLTRGNGGASAGLLLFAFALLLTLSAAGASDRGVDAERGARLFAIHCVSCHGAEGRGDGPMVEALRQRPTDLTRLEERGRRWVDEVRDLLAGAPGIGRVGVHGRREMPVWGVSLMDRSRVGGRGDEVAAEIDCLLSHLQEIQASRQP